MGKTKEEWIMSQEIETMEGWIEENYGDELGEEGSESWNDAIRAYREYSENEMNLYDEYDYYLTFSLPDAELIFRKDLDELSRILNISNEVFANYLFCKMAYAHVVTILEVYIEDTIKSLIMSNKKSLANTIKNVRPFCDTKFRLSDISLEEEGIKKFVLKKLSENLFHDIPKVLKILNGITEKNISIEITDICFVTSTRHDIVHRNGKNKDGEKLVIDVDAAKFAIKAVGEFAENMRLNTSLT